MHFIVCGRCAYYYMNGVMFVYCEMAGINLENSIWGGSWITFFSLGEVKCLVEEVVTQ